MEKRRPCRGQSKIRDRKRDSVRGISNETLIENGLSVRGIIHEKEIGFR